MFQELNLSYVSNLTDSALHKLLSTPRDTRPGLLDKKSRLKMLRKLSVRNTEITDVSMRYITQYLPQLSQLSTAGCWKLSDAGLAQLADAADTLSWLDISFCRAISDAGLTHLYKYVISSIFDIFIIIFLCRMSNLTRLDANSTQISSDGLNKFVSKSKHKLKVYGKVVERKHSGRSSGGSSSRKKSSK